MKTLIVAAIRCSLMFLVPSISYAISAQWDLDPISGDWNTADNWTPNGVPNGPADIATFGLSHATDVAISANTEVNGITFTSAATNPYTITVGSDVSLPLAARALQTIPGSHKVYSPISEDKSFSLTARVQATGQRVLKTAACCNSRTTPLRGERT